MRNVVNLLPGSSPGAHLLGTAEKGPVLEGQCSCRGLKLLRGMLTYQQCCSRVAVLW
jgi:hypothetical protein